MTTEIRFPEHQKVAAVADEMRLIAEFIDWASVKDYVFGREVTSNDTFGPPTWLANVSHQQMEKLLHEFYAVDTAQYYAERETMYQELKAANSN